MNLSGKVALVTGSGRRLGQAIALGLGEQGCSLMVHFHRSADQAQATAEQLEAMGVQASTVQADLRDASGIEDLFQQIDSRFGGLDVLVNSAAVLERRDLLEVTEADWARTIDLNLRASFFCLQHAARRMRARGGGAIVNLADLLGVRPWERFPVHSISKAGVVMLTQVAALALGPEIRVNAVAPGPVLRPEEMASERWKNLGESTPLGRPGRPEDVVATVIFLLVNDYVNGEVVVVDGGRQLS